MFSIHCHPHRYFPQRGYRIKPTNNQKKSQIEVLLLLVLLSRSSVRSTQKQTNQISNRSRHTLLQGGWGWGYSQSVLLKRTALVAGALAAIGPVDGRAVSPIASINQSRVASQGKPRRDEVSEPFLTNLVTYEGGRGGGREEELYFRLERRKRAQTNNGGRSSLVITYFIIRTYILFIRSYLSFVLELYTYMMHIGRVV